jgi:mannose-6-phosphate isomerase-like protein (cupin superfamily)
MSVRDPKPIDERTVEGRTDWQQSRGAFDALVPEETSRYWRALHVAAEDTVPMTNKRGEPITDNAASGAEAYHVISPATAGTISIRNGVITYPPRTGSGVRWHNAEHAYYVISGSGSIEIAGETHEFETGDGVFVPMRTHHRLVNDTDEPLKLLVVATMPQRPCEDLAATSIDYREYMEQI